MSASAAPGSSLSGTSPLLPLHSLSFTQSLSSFHFYHYYYFSFLNFIIKIKKNYNNNKRERKETFKRRPNMAGMNKTEKERQLPRGVLLSYARETQQKGNGSGAVMHRVIGLLLD